MKKKFTYVLVVIIFFITPLCLCVYGKEIPQLQRNNAVRAKAGRDKFEVDVVTSKQKVFIYKDGSLIKSIICSTGLPGDETPVGHFTIDDYYGLSFYNNKYKEGGKYWVGFIGSEYLFHSVPINANGQIIQSEASKLGTEASHGCIRMSVKDAYWFYSTIPKGADVFIRE